MTTSVQKTRLETLREPPSGIDLSKSGEISSPDNDLERHAMTATLAESAKKRSTLNLRVTPETRILIDRGAEARGLTLTDFILDAARTAAEQAVLDRSLFSCSPETFDAFLARLDAPAQPNDFLLQSLSAPTPWSDHDALPSKPVKKRA
jgi:uncharacterized protein (DUF1778 family)